MSVATYPDVFRPITLDSPMLAPAVIMRSPRNASAVLPPQPAAQFGSDPFIHVDQFRYSRMAPEVGLICAIGEGLGVLLGITP